MPGIVARIGGRPSSGPETDTVLGILKHFPFYETSSETCDRGWVGWAGIGRGERRLTRDHARRHLVAYHGDGAERQPDDQYAARVESIASLAGGDPAGLAARLGGSFAAACLDRETGAFHCLTDRFGHHRVYYRQLGDVLYLACELKAFMGWPEFPLEEDPAALRDLINYGYPLGDRTSLAGVKLLRPASHLTFQDGTLTVQRYWRPRYEPQDAPDELLREEGHRLFVETFAAKTAGAEQVILPVSGGLDSRILLGEALAQGKEPFSYTYGHRRSRETEVSCDLMEHLGVAPTRVALDDWPNAVDSVRRTSWFAEGMVNSTIAHLDVVLQHFVDRPRTALFINGIYGGPTNFSSGYHKPDELVTDMSRQEKIARIGRTMFSDRLHSAANYRKLTPDFAKVCDEGYDREIDGLLDEYEPASPLFGHQKDAFYADNRLCRFMNQVDLNRFYWDEVIPLTSNDLYDFYLRLPDDIKFGRRLHRQILVEHYPEASAVPTSATGLSVADELAGKPPIPPPTNARRLRVQHWLRRLSRGRYDPPNPANFRSHDYVYRRNRPLREYYESVLGDPQPLSRDYFDFDQVGRIMVELRQGAQMAAKMAEVMAWELWVRQLRARRWDI